MPDFKKDKRIRRHQRLRSKIRGTSLRPRLCVFRSNKHLYAQLIDDTKQRTLVAVNDIKMKVKERAKRAKGVGEAIASAALQKGIKKVIFDRGGFKYHGTIKILAEAARAAGLKF